MSENVKKEQEAEEKEGEEEEETEELLIKKDISELATILSENPEVEQQVREIIDYHLKEGIDRTTYGKIGSGLEILLGEGATRSIVNSCRFNDNEIFERLKGEIEGADVDKTLPFLQYLTALYGSEMEEAYLLFNEIPDDWMNSAITVYREEEEDVWFIDINLKKYSGEKIFLRMSPASAFTLVQRLVGEIGKLPREAVDEEVIKAFREETEGFKKKFLSDNGGRD
jgi:hypothetical protein